MLATEACRRLDALAESSDVYLEWSADLAAFGQAKAALGRGAATGIFEPDRRIGPGGWMAVRDRPSDDLIGIQAFRAVGDEAPDLWTHLMARLSLYPPVGKPIDALRSEVVSAEARSITGAIVYAGEVYVSPRARGRGLGKLLFRFGQVIVWEVYRPDVVFGLTAPTNTRPEFTAFTGFYGDEVETVAWRTADGSAVETEGLVWSGPQRMRELAADPLRDFEVGRPALRRSA